jgi:hypothetical protein
LTAAGAERYDGTAMSDTNSVGGSCLCGAVRFSVRVPTLWCAHCHCTMCQREHGAGYVTWFGAARAGFSLDAGAEHLVRYRSSAHGTRSFCGRCGSSLLCESTTHPDQVDVVLANMHAPIDRRPEMHVYFSDRAPWIDVRDDLPRLGGPTGMEPIPKE